MKHDECFEEWQDVHYGIRVILRYLKSRLDWVDEYMTESHQNDAVIEHYLPSKFRKLFPKLKELDEFVRSRTSEHCRRIESMLPPHSTRPRFLLRIHFPRLVVEQMIRHFGHPNYQVVADVTNVLLDLSESDELTEDSVRKAWKRYGPFWLFYRP